MQRKSAVSFAPDVEELKNRMTPGGDGPQPFRTYVVIEFSNKIPPATTEWILSKIMAPRSQKGGEMLVRTALDENGEENIIHLSATTERLLVAAELMEIKKPYKDGSLREVSMADLEHFQDSEDLDNFLSMTEKQRVILHGLESIRALSTDHHVPGIPKIELYKGEAIIPKVKEEGVISKLFPLHNKPVLKTLGKEWYQKFFGVQPLDQIHKYFGETIAMYFAFLGFYTMALIPPALIGILSSFSGTDNVNTMIFFSIFNLVWATVFLEAWKQNCSTLAFKWGTINTEQFEESRAQYYGVLGVNKVTGKLEPKYPKYKRMLKFYCVSIPIVIFCLFLAFLVMLLYFWMQEHADKLYATYDNIFGLVIVLLPSMVYAIIISIMNAFYRKMAIALNDWENHRLQSAYDNHIITKLVMFDFANCFMSLFWVAFYLQDMALLRSHLATLLITQQVIGQVREALLPYLMYKKRKSKITNLHAKQKNGNSSPGIEPLIDLEGTTTKQSNVNDEYLLQAKIDSSREEYDGTLDDYLEMFLQFGYVFLFSSVFPSAGFWALLNNITEIRSDAFKMCRIFQRPFSQPTSGIGAWQIAFEMMSVIAVVTNCALIGLSPQVIESASKYGSVNMVLVFVIAEHLILFVKVVLSYLIPDAPEWVETALARQEYQSKQAWRKDRNTQAQKHIEHRMSLIQPPLLEDLKAAETEAVEDDTKLIQ